MEPFRNLRVGELLVKIEDQDLLFLLLQLSRKEAGEREMILILRTELRHIVEGEMPAHQLASGGIADAARKHLKKLNIRSFHFVNSILVQQQDHESILYDIFRQNLVPQRIPCNREEDAQILMIKLRNPVAGCFHRQFPSLSVFIEGQIAFVSGKAETAVHK